jgi:serine/threonine-protein kinase
MADSQQRYRVVEKLESGGMAEVFRAESEGLQGFRKQVAIKRVLPHLSEKKKFISMFLDEARLSAHLSHSNCVQVFDIGVGDNAYFIVMEYVDGANLKGVAEALKKQGQAFPVNSAVWICCEICKGLAYAHELSDPNGEPLHIVHRDMSPPNVLITKHGEVKIVDFGLAKANSQLEKSEPGIIKGKFSYLSPEAAMGGDVDGRTDIFAVGIILFELITGQRLFLGDTDFQTVKKVQQAQIPNIRQLNPEVTPELDRILHRALARDPNMRYRNARDLARDLNKFLFDYGKPVSSLDVAGLVQSAMRDKEKERAKKRAASGSIIDKLIEEALFEFTSLSEEQKAAQAAQGKKGGADQSAAPLDLAGFVDPKGWLDEVKIDDVPRPARAPIPGMNLGEGNLSALEDDEPSVLPPPPAPSPQPALRVPTPAAQQHVPQSAPRPLPAQPAQEKKGGGGALIGIVVALVLVGGAAAAAWFGHLIPH